MKILSLFDGISCARVALEKAGLKIENYFSSEVDKYAIQIAQKNYPNTIQMGNVLDVDCTSGKLHYGRGLLAETDIELVIGGSPCQDLSIAKKNREGLNGKRSGLFWEYVRILKELKPKYFILENVASMPKEAKRVITETLWNIEPIMINAALVSAQNRKRLFWIGRLVGNKYEKVEIPQPKDRGIFLKDVLEQKISENFYVKDKSNTIRVSGRSSGVDNRHNWDTIRIGEYNKGGQGDRIYSASGKSVSLSANGGGRGAKTGLYITGVNVVSRGKEKDKNGKSYCLKVGQSGSKGMVSIIQTPRGNNKGGEKALNGKVPTLSSSSWEYNNKLLDNGIIRRLTPIECERLQSLPDNYTRYGYGEGWELDTPPLVEISNSQRYKCLGNAFNVEVVAHILRNLK